MYVYKWGRVDKWLARDNRARVRVAERRRDLEEETKRGGVRRKKVPPFYRDPNAGKRNPLSRCTEAESPALSDIRQGRLDSVSLDNARVSLALLHSGATFLRFLLSSAKFTTLNLPRPGRTKGL